MHEFEIAKRILNQVLKKTGSDVKKILRMKVKAGNLEMLTEDSLQFAFQQFAKDSIAQDCIIELEEFPGSGISIESIEIEE